MKLTTTIFSILALVLITGTASAGLIGGAIQDLDAELGVSVTGTDVTAWANQGTAGDDMATTNGTPQLLPGATPTGKAAIGLTNDRLNGDDIAAFDALLQGSGYTWFIVTKSHGVNAGGANGKNNLMGDLNIGSGWLGLTAGINGNETPYGINRPTGSDQRLTAATAINDDSWHVLAFRLAAGTTGTEQADIYVDSATADVTGSVGSIAGATESGALAVGAERAGGSEYVDADIARILIYDSPLSDVDLAENIEHLTNTYIVPEPGSFMLLCLGALGMIGLIRRKK